MISSSPVRSSHHICNDLVRGFYHDTTEIHLKEVRIKTDLKVHCTILDMLIEPLGQLYTYLEKAWSAKNKKCIAVYFTSFFSHFASFCTRGGILVQDCQHYRFFHRSTESRKWFIFLQIFIWSFKIFFFFTDFAIFWFFSTFSNFLIFFNIFYQ